MPADYKPLISSKVMLKLLVNLAETTFSASILRNLNYLLTKRYFTTLLNHIFMPQPHDLLVYKLTHSFEPYESLTWELAKRKLIVCSSGVQQNPSHEMSAVFIPRVKIVAKFDFDQDAKSFADL